MTIEVTVQIWREGNQYVAHAMPLDVMSCGDSPERARTALDEAVRAFLLTASDTGALESVLEECGYEQHGNDWLSPPFVAVERHSLALAL